MTGRHRLPADRHPARRVLRNYWRAGSWRAQAPLLLYIARNSPPGTDLGWLRAAVDELEKTGCVPPRPSATLNGYE